MLPEEAVNHRIVVPEATRDAFLQQLCASSNFLLSSLQQIAAGPLGAEVMVQVYIPRFDGEVGVASCRVGRNWGGCYCVCLCVVDMYTVQIIVCIKFPVNN